MQLQENALLKNGTYRIVRCIGQGGYGITYLATKAEEVRGDMGAFTTNVAVAIKELFVKAYCVRDTNTSDVLAPTEEGKEQMPNLKRDFIREASSMSRMEHPNIVPVIDYFEEHQTAYYVMQYMEGCTLADKVGRSGPLTSEEAQKIIYQIAAALMYLHDKHVCHYDVKPSNIMLMDDGKAVLIDFGISRHYDEQGNSTTVRSVGYSSGFAAPEQVVGDIQKFSPTSDIYSLAATLHFALTGKIPTENNKDNDNMPGNSTSDMPQEMRDAITKGMNADSSLRPQTVKEWLALLDDSTRTRPKTQERKTQGKDAPGKVEKEGKQEKEGLQDKEGNRYKEWNKEKERKQQKYEYQKAEQQGDGSQNKPRTLQVSWKKAKPWVTILLCIAACALIFFLVTRKTRDEMEEGKGTVKSEVTGMEWKKKNKYGNTFSYTGTVIDSIPNGHGRAEYSDGSSYEGTFQDGMRDDNDATYRDPNGNTFKGAFSHDTLVRGRITAPDGRYYEGTFSDDKPFNGKWYDAEGMVMYIVEEGKLTSTEE